MKKVLWRLSDKYADAGFTLEEDCGFVELKLKGVVVGSWLEVSAHILKIEARADRYINETKSDIEFVKGN